jgi:hypothetical protein
VRLLDQTPAGHLTHIPAQSNIVLPLLSPFRFIAFLRFFSLLYARESVALGTYILFARASAVRHRPSTCLSLPSHLCSSEQTSSSNIQTTTAAAQQ